MIPKTYLSLVFFFMLLGCDFRPTANATQPSAEANKVAPVQVVSAEVGNISSHVTGTCTIEVEEKVDVFAEISGVVKFFRPEGAEVKEKDIIIQLKDETLRLDSLKAEAEYLKQNTLFETVKKEHSQKLISDQDYVDALHRLSLAKIQKEQADVTLSKAEIRAPFPGIITEQNINMGEQLFPNKKLCSLVNMDTMIAEVFVPETEVSKVQEKQLAEISLDSSSRIYKAKVKRISSVVNRQSGMIKVTLSILPPREGLRPGGFARVTIIVGEWKNVVLIPKKALIYRDDKVRVFLLTPDHKTEEREIKLGIEDSNRVQVLDGLKGGEWVITAGQYGLQKGQKVEIFSSPKQEGE